MTWGAAGPRQPAAAGAPDAPMPAFVWSVSAGPVEQGDEVMAWRRNVFSWRCAITALAMTISGTLRPSRRFLACPTAWPTSPACALTTSSIHSVAVEDLRRGVMQVGHPMQSTALAERSHLRKPAVSSAWWLHLKHLAVTMCRSRRSHGPLGVRREGGRSASHRSNATTANCK